MVCFEKGPESSESSDDFDIVKTGPSASVCVMHSVLRGVMFRGLRRICSVP